MGVAVRRGKVANEKRSETMEDMDSYGYVSLEGEHLLLACGDLLAQKMGYDVVLMTDSIHVWKRASTVLQSNVTRAEGVDGFVPSHSGGVDSMIQTVAAWFSFGVTRDVVLTGESTFGLTAFGRTFCPGTKAPVVVEDGDGGCSRRLPHTEYVYDVGALRYPFRGGKEWPTRFAALRPEDQVFEKRWMVSGSAPEALVY